MKENESIEIKKTDKGLYLLRFLVNGKGKESYRPETKEIVMMWATSIINGFEPERCPQNR